MAYPVSFRLRPGKDDDIAEALEKAAKIQDKADIIRAALRSYLLKGPERQPRKLDPTALEGVEIKKKEKDAEDLNGALDNLLDDF